MSLKCPIGDFNDIQWAKRLCGMTCLGVHISLQVLISLSRSATVCVLFSWMVDSCAWVHAYPVIRAIDVSMMAPALLNSIP